MSAQAHITAARYLMNGILHHSGRLTEAEARIRKIGYPSETNTVIVPGAGMEAIEQAMFHFLAWNPEMAQATKLDQLSSIDAAARNKLFDHMVGYPELLDALSNWYHSL